MTPDKLIDAIRIMYTMHKPPEAWKKAHAHIKVYRDQECRKVILAVCDQVVSKHGGDTPHSSMRNLERSIRKCANNPGLFKKLMETTETEGGDDS